MCVYINTYIYIYPLTARRPRPPAGVPKGLPPEGKIVARSGSCLFVALPRQMQDQVSPQRDGRMIRRTGVLVRRSLRGGGPRGGGDREVLTGPADCNHCDRTYNRKLLRNLCHFLLTTTRFSTRNVVTVVAVTVCWSCEVRNIEGVGVRSL